MHVMHCFQCAGQLSETLSYGSCMTDLDNILIEGDKLYKSLNKNDCLNVDEIPRQIKIYDNINIDKK